MASPLPHSGLFALVISITVAQVQDDDFQFIAELLGSAWNADLYSACFLNATTHESHSELEAFYASSCSACVTAVKDGLRSAEVKFFDAQRGLTDPSVFTSDLMQMGYLLTRFDKIRESRVNSGESCLSTLGAEQYRLAGWLYLMSPWYGETDVSEDRRLSADIIRKFEVPGLPGAMPMVAYKFLTDFIVGPSYMYFMSKGRADSWKSLQRRSGDGARVCTLSPFRAADADCLPHDNVFHNFPPAGIPNDYRNGFVVDFLGVHQRFEHYKRWYPIEGPGAPDVELLKARTLGTTEPWWQYLEGWSEPASWPSIDEEYIEHVDMLQAVLDANRSISDRPFVVAEIGCGAMAPWASRAVAAWHRLRSNHRCEVGLVEVEADMIHSLDLKQLGLADCNTKVIHADAGKQPISELLETLYPTIDYLDIDIQGAEVETVSHSMSFLKARVKTMHIATHGRETHITLEQTLREAGWSIDWSFAPLSFSKTPWGYVPFFDGVLTASMGQKA